MPNETPLKHSALEIQEKTFAKDVLARSAELPVIVVFWARWDGPSRQLVSVFEQLEKDYRGRFVFGKANVDENRKLANTYQANAVPRVVVFRHEQSNTSLQGLRKSAELRAWLDKLLPELGAPPRQPVPESQTSTNAPASPSNAADSSLKSEETFAEMMTRLVMLEEEKLKHLLASLNSKPAEEVQAPAEDAEAESEKPKHEKKQHSLLARALRAMGEFVENPYVQLAVGLVLVATSVIESWDTIAEDVENFRLRMFHGTMLYGIAHVFRTLPDLVEGVEHTLEGVD